MVTISSTVRTSGSRSTRTLANGRDGIELAVQLPSDEVTEQRGHTVPNLGLGAIRVGQRPQPLLDRHRLHILDRNIASYRKDVLTEVVLVGADGSW
jgi:hypothetical protein